jgi:hypothetical protein
VETSTLVRRKGYDINCPPNVFEVLKNPVPPPSNPGFESPRPVESGGWIGAAVDKFRVLLLDQVRFCRDLVVRYRRLSYRGVRGAEG